MANLGSAAPTSIPPRDPELRRLVGLILVAVVLGFWLFTQVLPLPALIVPWIVMLLGLHFLPFASTFGFPIFERLGGILFGLGIVGGAVFLTFTPAASASPVSSPGLRSSSSVLLPPDLRSETSEHRRETPREAGSADAAHGPPSTTPAELELKPRAYDHPDATRLIAEAQEFYVALYGGPDETPFTPEEFVPQSVLPGRLLGRRQ